MKISIKIIREKLHQFANPEKAKVLQRFFKTGKGEYGEGDIFVGITIPQIRAVAKEYRKDVDSKITEELLHSKVHEERMLALLILVQKYQDATKVNNNEVQEEIYKIYMNNTKYINNWDLVDLSAPNIVGHYLLDRDKKILIKFAKSDHLWQKRIAILATYYFIKNGNLQTTLEIAEILLNDKHNLIHKSVGWMLRELGKVNQDVEELFLLKHYKNIPRTTLRYAIEKFDDTKRKNFLRGDI